MTLTPLHIAFVWPLKPRFRKLHFAALTVGAVIPDIESLVTWMFGWSVFCGWDFPWSLAPDRLVLHSIVGALTIDAILTILFVKMIGKLGVERRGIHGFTNVKINAAFFASAAIGSLSHVFVYVGQSCPFISTHFIYNDRTICNHHYRYDKQTLYFMPLCI